MAAGGIKVGSGVSQEEYGPGWEGSPAGAAQGALFNVLDLHLFGVANGRVDEFGEISSVASGAVTTILTYTVPAGKVLDLIHVEAGGSNVADYRVKVNGVRLARKRTYFGSDLHLFFDFSIGVTNGYELTEGDVLAIEVMHSRPSSGDFEARFFGLLEDL